MANIKTTAEQWEKVRAYYESGLKLKEISEKTKIAIPNISKKAKADGWSKANEKQTLIIDESRVREAKANFTQIERQVHEELVDERTRELQYFNKTQKRFAQISAQAIESKLDENGKAGPDFNLMDLRTASAVVRESREGILGKDPSIALQVNNNNNTFESILAKVRRD